MGVKNKLTCGVDRALTLAAVYRVQCARGDLTAAEQSRHTILELVGFFQGARLCVPGAVAVAMARLDLAPRAEAS